MKYQPYYNGREYGLPVTWVQLIALRCCVKGLKYKLVRGKSA